MDKQQGPPVKAQENDIQRPGVGHNGNKRKKDVYMCVTESLCCTAEINTTLKINYTSIKFFFSISSVQQSD